MPELSLHSLAPYAFILIAALAAGFVNAIAGGGTFFTYPAFVAGGVPPAFASGSNNIGLWPGNAMATFAYRQELYAVRADLPFLSAVTLTGSGIGALLLLEVGNDGFARLLPPLVLFATLLFTYAERVRQWLLKKAQGRGTARQAGVSRGSPRSGARRRAARPAAAATGESARRR